MSFTIRTPESASELATLFESRATVFFGENILHHPTEPSLSDEVDFYPSTINLIAVADEGLLIGGVRLTLPTADYVPADSNFFDFRPYLPAANSPASYGSMLWVDVTQRTLRAGSNLVKIACKISELDHMEHLCAATRPKAAKFLSRLGFKQVAETFIHPIEMVPVVPMIRPLRAVDGATVDLREESIQAQTIFDRHRDGESARRYGHEYLK